MVSGINSLLCRLGDVSVFTYRQRHAVRDAGPRKGTFAHSLGTDGLWHPVYSIKKVPHHLTYCTVSYIHISVVTDRNRTIMHLLNRFITSSYNQ